MQLESLLSQNILNKSDKGGNEYGWKFEDILEVAKDVKKQKLGNLGGQPEFIFEEGTCEIYWHSIKIKKTKSENWMDYVERSHLEFYSQFKNKIAPFDYLKEAESFAFLKEKIDTKENEMETVIGRSLDLEYISSNIGE